MAVRQCHAALLVRRSGAMLVTMSKFQIKVRNLETNETLIANLDAHADACAYLSERPQMIEIIGVLSQVSDDAKQELIDAIRPYDDEERAALVKSAEERNKQMKEQQEQFQVASAADAKDYDERARQEARAADPNRPMSIHWDLETGFTHGDEYDERPINDTVERAVRAWVEERNEWVANRDQIVADADVFVWPNDLPAGDDETRVMRGGQFTPRDR